MLNIEQDLFEFHTEFGHLVQNVPAFPDAKTKSLRMKLIKEEVGETLEAIEANDMGGIADGICDAIYVLVGTAISYGIPFEECWLEVQRANMAKKGGETRPDGKTLKPEGWTPPDIHGVLTRNGYKEDE